MNLLIYLEPLHELDNPFWHEAWLGFADRMATALKRRWPEARAVCVTNRALAYAKPQAPFDIVVLDHTELVPRFGATAAAVAAHWDAGGNDDSNTAMAALLRARLGGFEPGVCVSFSPAPFLRTAFPEAPALFFEHGMVSRPPFPLTGYLDPFDIVRGSALVRLKDEVRGFQPTAAEAAFVAELRERYFGHIESGNRLTATVASWREKFPRLLLLAGQFSNFYAFDCYAANKTPLDLVLHALAAAGPSVGVIVTEHPNHPFLNERMVEWLAASHPNFLWSPEFNATTWRAASQWLMAHVDAVATVSSKVGLETLLWRKPLLVLGSSHLDTIADGHDLAELDAVCARPWPAWKDAVLAWHLTRYTMPFDLLFETDLFCDRLELALAQHRSNNRDAAFDVAFAPIDDIRRSYDAAMTAYGVGAGGPAATKAPEPMQPTADDSLSSGSDQAMAEAAERTAETDRLKEEAANLQAQLDAVHASTSWRLTAPLRAVSRMLLPRDFAASGTGDTINQQPSSANSSRETSECRDGFLANSHTRIYSVEVAAMEQGTSLPADFDGATYLRLHPDVLAAGDDPASHYLNHGIQEGRSYKENAPTHTPAHTPIGDRFVQVAPSSQNVLDLFQGDWSSAMPFTSGLNTEPGYAGLFEDGRITWANQVLGPFGGKTVLELGPLEGGHSYMLHGLGAKVTAVEANSAAYLRCLCIKEIFNLIGVRYLLGDFSKFLSENNQRFDAVIASGVLYHMTNPVELLKSIARSTDRVFLWTHYYDESVYSNRADAHLFRRDKGVDDLLGGYGGVRKLYAQEALDWTGFTGGTNVHAIWMDKKSILRFFADYGFKTSINFDQADHPNGPAFAVCAQRP